MDVLLKKFFRNFEKPDPCVVSCVWETTTEQQRNSAKCQKKIKKKNPDIVG